MMAGLAREARRPVPDRAPWPQLWPGRRTSASRPQPQRLAHGYLVILTPTIQPGSMKQAASEAGRQS
jgi:hypothetical protein